MKRAIIIVLDSFGIGGAPDAARFGDEGSDTLGHIAEACATGQGDRVGLREGRLALPNLDAMGLGAAAKLYTGKVPPGLTDQPRGGRFGVGREGSKGTDTPSGHWEIAGVPVPIEWGYFPRTEPAFPAELTDATYKFMDEKAIINVGSVGQPRDLDPRACYTILSPDRIQFVRIEYDVEKTASKIKAIGALSDWLGDRLYEGR